jgi:hypothetical protein
MTKADPWASFQGRFINFPSSGGMARPVGIQDRPKEYPPANPAPDTRTAPTSCDAGFSRVHRGNGHFLDAIGLIYDDDFEAEEKAEQIINGHDVELWQLDRKVAPFRRSQNNGLRRFLSGRVIAFAGHRVERFEIDDLDDAPGITDRPTLLYLGRHLGHGGAANAEHLDRNSDRTPACRCSREALTKRRPTGPPSCTCR